MLNLVPHPAELYHGRVMSPPCSACATLPPPMPQYLFSVDAFFIHMQTQRLHSDCAPTTQTSIIDADMVMLNAFWLNNLFDWKELLSCIKYCQVDSNCIWSFFIIPKDTELLLLYLIIYRHKITCTSPKLIFIWKILEKEVLHV